MCTDNELDRSPEAQITNTVFFEDVNDITIYVEDKDKEAEYETIFKRLFQEKYKINKIYLKYFLLEAKLLSKNAFIVKKRIQLRSRFLS